MSGSSSTVETMHGVAKLQSERPAPLAPAPLRVTPRHDSEPESLSPFSTDVPSSSSVTLDSKDVDLASMSGDIDVSELASKPFLLVPKARAATKLPVTSVKPPPPPPPPAADEQLNDLSVEELSVAHPQLVSTRAGIWVATSALVVGGLLAAVCFLPSTRARMNHDSAPAVANAAAPKQVPTPTVAAVAAAPFVAPEPTPVVALPPPAPPAPPAAPVVATPAPAKPRARAVVASSSPKPVAKPSTKSTTAATAKTTTAKKPADAKASKSFFGTTTTSAKAKSSK